MIAFRRGTYDAAQADFWDHKHPTAPIRYNGRTIPGTTTHFALDVRHFVWASDVILADLVRGPDRLLGEAAKTDDPDRAAWMVQRWAVENLVYTSDKTLTEGRAEFWLFPGETLARKKDDCEGGACLIASLLRVLGIPGDRVRVAAGFVDPGQGAAAGGHAWACYRRLSDEQWVALDWCYYQDSLVAVQEKEPQKTRAQYFNAERIWFSFNDSHAWSHDRDFAMGGRVHGMAGRVTS